MTPIAELKTHIEQGSLEGIKALAARIGIAQLLALREDGPNKPRRGAVHFAAASNRATILNWLRESGANMADPDLDGNTPLHVAAIKGSAEAASALISMGAPVDAANNSLKTPYMFALAQSSKGVGFASCAKLLAQAGANASAVDKDGKTAADYVQERASLPTRLASLPTIDPMRAGSAEFLAALNGVAQQASEAATRAFDDPLAPPPPPEPKPALSQNPAPAANTEMTREAAIAKLKELGFEILGAKEGEPQLTGRDAEVEEVAALLDKRKNVMLVGKAGTGKRSIAKSCAERLAKQGKIVMSVPSSCFRGNKYAGSVNENIQKWLGPALSLGDELVLFINDAHQLSTGKTSSDTTDTPIQILREQMDPRKEKRLTLLCATTPGEVAALEEDDSFMGQFSRKPVAPMGKKEALAAILSEAGSRELLRDYPGAERSDYERLCAQTVELCDKYLFNQSFPAKAFEFAARALAQGGPSAWTQEKLGALFCQTYSVPKEIVEGRMTADSPYYQLETRLKETLMGQDRPIADISKAVASQIVLANPGDHKPVSMLFAGPTGVGKTEATESMARILGLPILSLSMGEFTSKYDTAELKKKIAEFATKNYAGVILVDEIEKSDPGVRDLFLNLFDKGSVGSGEDKVDCGFMICVATTNVGARAAVALKQRLRESFGDPKIHDSWTREQMIEAGFRPEFVNRIGLACDFNDIIPSDALKIAKLMIAKKSKELKNSRGIDLVVDESVAKEHAADVFDADYGARGIKRCVEDTMNAIVAAQSIALAIGPGCRIEATSSRATITAKVTTSEGAVSEARIAGQDGNAELQRLNAVLGGFSAVVQASAAQASIQSSPETESSPATSSAKP